MNYLSYILFLCFDKDDISDVKRLVDRINKELGSSIEIGTDAIEPHEESAFPKIEQSEAVLVFLSETAKGSEYVKNCLDYANALSKRIFPIKIDRDSSGDTMPDLSGSGMDCFDTDDEEQFGKLVKQLKDILKPASGNEVPNATLVHIYTDKEAKVCRYGKVLCVAIPGQDNTICLGKGVHKLDFTSIGEAPESYSIPYEVKEYNGTQSLTINFKRRREQLGKEGKKNSSNNLMDTYGKKGLLGLTLLILLILAVLFFKNSGEFDGDMTAPVMTVNKEGFITLDGCQREHEHLSIVLYEDCKTIDVYYDQKLIQTIKKDDWNVNEYGSLADTDRTAFLDVNFDGFVDILIGPATSRSYSCLIVWDDAVKQFVLTQKYIANFLLDPVTRSVFEYGSFSWCGMVYERAMIDGTKWVVLELLTEISEPSAYADNEVQNRFTLNHPQDKRLLVSTEDYKKLPEVWQKFLYFYEPDELHKAQDNDKVITAFITDMFENKRYWFDDFLEEHCSRSLLKKLKDGNEYEGDFYAYWLFDNGAQDVRYEDGDERNRRRIISVTPLENGWYLYEYTSSGFRGRNAVHATVKDGNVWMDDLQKVDSEYDDDV